MTPWPNPTRRALIVGLALAPAAPVFAQTPSTSTLLGDWNGILDLGTRALRMRLVLPRTGGAPLLYSLDQAATVGIPGEAASLTAERISISFPTINATLSGRLDTRGQIDGLFVQGGPIPIVLAREQAAVVWPALTTGRLETWRAAAALPALVAVASRRGGTTEQWQVGERAMGSGLAVQAGDQWHLGSNTKSMTATLAARLVEKGLIGWDDTVGSALASVAPQMRDAYREVTFRHLFSHRSGLPANIAAADLSKFAQASADPVADRRAYVALALSMEPKGHKEATYEYSNAGYLTATAMIEAKLGQPWEALVREHLFAPLNITSAGFGPPGEGDPKRQPVRHINGIANPPNTPPDNPAVLNPAGRVHMSMADLSLYLAAHRDRSSLLSAASWDRLHTPPFGGDYAYGWIVAPDGTRWHNGTNTQWYAAMQFNAAKGFAAASACNDLRGQGIVHAALKEAASAV